MDSMPGVGVVGLASSREEAITIAESQFVRTVPARSQSRLEQALGGAK
jgi:hypothetical protein